MSSVDQSDLTSVYRLYIHTFASLKVKDVKAMKAIVRKIPGPKSVVQMMDFDAFVDARPSYYMARFLRYVFDGASHLIADCSIDSALYPKVLKCLSRTMQCIGGQCNRIDLPMVSWVVALSRVSVLEFCCICSHLVKPPLTAMCFINAKVDMSSKRIAFDDSSLGEIGDDMMKHIVAVCSFARIFARILREIGSREMDFAHEFDVVFNGALSILNKISRVMLDECVLTRSDIALAPITLVCEDFARHIPCHDDFPL
jgi:hypothetical protein